jgi:chromosome segregation ATPase
MAASVLEDSSAWQAKRDEAMKSALAELSRNPDRSSLPSSRVHRMESHDFEQRQQWANSQITIINSSTRSELAALEAMRSQQQEVFQEQLAEKNEQCKKLVLQRREEAAQLRSMISSLSAAISSARNQAKMQADEARRRASASTKRLRTQRRRQREQIAALRRTLDRERRQFEHDFQQVTFANSAAADDKRQHVAQLRVALENIRNKMREKQAQNDGKFNEHIEAIAQLREQLQKAREDENEKQTRLMEMRKVCASTSKKLSARKDEAASLKRQCQMLARDNEELESEIAKVENKSRAFAVDLTSLWET